MPALWTINSASNVPLDNGTLISDKTAVTPATDDYIIIGDTSDSWNLKKALISDLPSWWGWIGFNEVKRIDALSF